MNFRAFRGGVKLSEHKSASAREPVSLTIEEGDEFVVPFVQHIGIPAVPVVSKGAEVGKGSALAVGKEGLSVPVHSPADGTVVFIGAVDHPTYGKTPGCVVKASAQKGGYEKIGDFSSVSEAVRTAGIVGMGGAGFPVWAKLESGRGKVDVVLINASECEPYLTCDHAVMLNYPEEVLKGAVLVKEFLGASSVVIATEDNKKDAAAELNKYAPVFGAEVVVVPARYPQGGEKQLIKTALGRTVPEGALPAAVGVSVHNVATVRAVYEAVEKRKPLMERVVTISGDVERPSNVVVPIGTPASVLFKRTGNRIEDGSVLVFGGPMTGCPAGSPSVPVIKTTGGVLSLKERRPLPVRPCVRCGRCADACAMGLVPRDLESAYAAGDIARMIEGHVTSCIECGCCSYVCPSGRPLTESVRAGKKRAQLMAKRKNK